jgi:hypothetical protein
LLHDPAPDGAALIQKCFTPSKAEVGAAEKPMQDIFLEKNVSVPRSQMPKRALFSAADDNYVLDIGWTEAVGMRTG